MVTTRSLVSPTTQPLLEKALREKLQRRNEVGGSLGELEPLAIRLGLMQNSLKPRFREPQLLVSRPTTGSPWTASPAPRAGPRTRPCTCC